MRLPSLTDLEAWATRIEEGIPFPLGPHPEVERLQTELSRARAAVKELEAKHLVIGFLGGTGVGKSTLLNALAGEEISRAGDRRPTTDLAVCYHHRDFPPPRNLAAEDLAHPPPPHDVDFLRGVTLLDLPDIDSRQGSHRDRVLRVLPHLDLLLVVTSVDKYADAILYEEIRAFPQSPRNLVFVLNAVDRITPDEQRAIEADFSEKLTTHAQLNGIEILPTSALQTVRDASFTGRGHLGPLRALLEKLGGESARRQVLIANAETSMERLLAAWDAHLPADEVDRWFDSLSEVYPEPPRPEASWLESLQRALEDAVGPAYFVARKLRLFGARDRVPDPFHQSEDPAADHAERLLGRPLRLARHHARLAAEPLADRLNVTLPEAPDGDPPEETRPLLEKWVDRLRRRAPRLAWKLRAHTIPVGIVSILVARLVIGVVPGEDESWPGAAFRVVWQALQALSPTTLALMGIALALYYLACYPYFLYRLERALHRESEAGARLYTEAWQGEFRAAWSDPFHSAVSTARKWWQDVQAQRQAFG